MQGYLVSAFLVHPVTILGPLHICLECSLYNLSAVHTVRLYTEKRIYQTTQKICPLWSIVKGVRFLREGSGSPIQPPPESAETVIRFTALKLESQTNSTLTSLFLFALGAFRSGEGYIDPVCFCLLGGCDTPQFLRTLSTCPQSTVFRHSRKIYNKFPIHF